MSGALPEVLADGHQFGVLGRSPRLKLL